MTKKIIKFRDFIGKEAWSYFVLSFFTGLAWFAVESSFVFVMQGFLFSIGLLTRAQVFLPTWFPVNLGGSVTILVLFGLVRAGVLMFKTYFASQTQIAFTCGQRSELLQYGLKNASNVSSKKLIATFTEITTQAGVVIFGICTLANTLVAAFLFFLLGLKLAPVEMVIGVSLLSLFLLPLKKFSKKTNDLGMGLSKEWENVSDSLITGLKNYFFLSVYNQIDHEIKKGRDSLGKFKSHFTNYSKVIGIVSAFPLVIGIGVLSLITYISVKFIHTDGIKLVSFFYLFIRLSQAASEANATFSNVKFNFPGFKILYEWRMRSIKSEEAPKLQIKKIQEGPVLIEFANVAFRYDNQDFLFKDLSFKISTGDVLIIKGESGTGKSSLLSLMLDINKPTRGEIFIDNFSTKNFKLDLQNILAYVGPEPFMIAGTVRENLLYGFSSANVSDSEIWSVLEKARVNDLIHSLPNKLNELVFDIPQFSTGQKQRLSFARALLRKPRLLVLDEATANLDLETEMIIIDNLQETLKNYTTVIVTHKDSFDGIGTRFLSLEKNDKIQY